jgi:hypothetical protein
MLEPPVGSKVVRVLASIMGAMMYSSTPPDHFCCAGERALPLAKIIGFCRSRYKSYIKTAYAKLFWLLRRS